MQIDVMNDLIYLVTHGSQAYDLATPESDFDIKGVLIPPENYLLGYYFNFEQSINNDELHKTYHPSLGEDIDSVVYSLQKFFKLAADCNPNIIEVLFVDDENILFNTSAGKLLREHRDLFISLKAKHTFSGYAHSQLKRIQTHRSWFLNPPKKKPERSDFSLPKEKGLNGSDLGAIKKLENTGYVFNDNIIELMKREKAYAQSLQYWKQYNSWKETRNPKRAELERKYGFDCKHASHLIRLYRMSVEILKYGKVIVKRPDAKELLTIKQGMWTYEQLIEEVEKYAKETDKLYEENPAKLPKSPDHKKLNELCIKMHKEKIKFA